jgi:hypothetical protein
MFRFVTVQPRDFADEKHRTDRKQSPSNWFDFIATSRTPSSLPQDGNIGIGVFPQRQEVLLSGVAFRGVTLERVGPCQAKMGQRAHRKFPHNSRVINDFLKRL